MKMWPDESKANSSKNNFQCNGVDVKTSQQNLPIYNARKKFIEEVRKFETCIIIGETASGKTTQIPQFILEEGLSHGGLIACTQPRRVAAITIAERVAQEMDCEVGKEVGYHVRFEDCSSSRTKIKYLTDGMLLRESIGDRLLQKYSFVILDEAHERTIHTDVLFGIVKNAQKQRKLSDMSKLKLIIMSATMDVDHFSHYFNNAPVLYVEGRLHPIKIKYTAIEQSDYLNAALITILQIHQEESAEDDILVFLTGQEEIESMVKTIKDISVSLPPSLPKLLVCPLYASLPQAQQLRVFRQTPHGSRKIVLSTNVAETSVTIKGIKYVVDTGKVKAKNFYPSSGLDVLAVQWISQAQAWQRAGRAGRERSGIVYRLYTENEYENLKPNTVPEIQRCNLSNTLLQMMAVGVENIKKFDFIDPPSKSAISVALEELQILGAIEVSESGRFKLTNLGRKMSKFPLEPKLSKSVVSSMDHNCIEEILSLVSLLSVENILTTPQAKREEALAVRKKFTASEGDFVTLLNIYRAFKHNKGNKIWCYENFINLRKMNLVMDIRKQLRDLCLKANIPVTPCRLDLTALRKCLVVGFFINAAELQSDGAYRGIHSGQTVHIHPSSCLFGCKPAYVIFHELIHTSKCYMRDICVVDPEWLYESAPEYFQMKLKGRR